MKTSLMGDPSLEIAGKRNELNQAGAGLAKTRFDMTAAMPVDNAFGESFEGMANDMGKTRGWKYVLQQAFRGLGAGAKSAANKDKVAKLENIASGMSFFEDQNKAMQKDIDGIQKKQELKKKLEPLANMGYKVNNSKMPDSEKDRNFSEIIQEGVSIGLIPEGSYFVARTNGTNDILYFNPATGKKEHFDFSPYVSQTIREDTQKELDRAIDQQRADASTTKDMAAANKYNAETANMPKALDIRGKEADTAAQNADSKTVKLIKDLVGEEIDAKEDLLRNAPRMLEIVERNPNLWQSLSQLQWQNSDPSYWQMQTRKWMAGDQNSRDAAEMLKYVRKMQLDVSRGFTRPNQFIEKMGSEAVPNFNMPAASFKKLLGEQVMDAQEDVNKLNKRLDTIAGKRKEQFSEAWKGRNYMPDENQATTPTQSGETGSNGQGAGGTITLYDPKSKATKTIPTSDYAKSKELAKKQGFGVIE